MTLKITDILIEIICYALEFFIIFSQHLNISIMNPLCLTAPSSVPYPIMYFMLYFRHTLSNSTNMSSSVSCIFRSWSGVIFLDSQFSIKKPHPISLSVVFFLMIDNQAFSKFLFPNFLIASKPTLSTIQSCLFFMKHLVALFLYVFASI